MTTSTKLGIPYVAASQATPEVTHNQALYLLEAFTRGVKDRTNNPPGGTPADGDTYLVGTAGTGAWAGKDNCIAVYVSNTWRFCPGFDSDGAQIAMGADQEGMHIYVQDEDLLYKWTGSVWVPHAKTPIVAVGGLPAAATYPGARYIVNDANATLAAGIGTTVAAGGANIVPVFSDGTNWVIG